LIYQRVGFIFTNLSRPRIFLTVQAGPQRGATTGSNLKELWSCTEFWSLL
jgi:hypothetical protein